MEPILEAKSLNLWYGQNHALHDVSVAIPERQITAFIGPSGCGKSTFLRCLNRLEEPDGGKDTVFQTRPDVQIGYIGQYDLPADTVTALQDALTPYCTDLNGDGKVVVQVNSYTVDFNAENDNTDAYNQMAGVTRLSADLSDSGTLYVMLIADPAGFQKSTGALAYLDGTPPEDDADDWQNMVYRWTDCPVLAGMDLGDYDGYTLLDDATGSNQSVLSTLYVGRRAVLDEEQAAHYADGEELWQTLTAGAVSTAAAE